MVFKEPKRVSLHNFFVFYPIDIILLNKNKEVIEIKQNFRPFTFWKSKNKAQYVIELAKNKSKGKIRVNNQLAFV